MVKELVPQLHEPESQNLDAKRVAEYLGLTIEDMAQILAANRSTLTRHPSTAKLQDKLGVMAGIIASVQGELEGSQERTRMWFRTGNRRLGGQSPLQVLKEGKLQVLARAVYRMETAEGL